jgi:aryl-phospho-beta-D-glucosidase BglC (GH1 family)
MRSQLSFTALLTAAGSLVHAAPAKYEPMTELVTDADLIVASTSDVSTSIGAATRSAASTSVAGWFSSREWQLHPLFFHCIDTCSFITPSIFESHSTPDYPIIDEWTLCEKVGQQACADVLKPHWDSFVSLDDFWKIKNAGFNLIRIPVGYWSYVDPWGPYAQGAAPYVDKAIDWARQTGLKVVIDLHGAPKSQNGFDHSGHRAPNPGWGDADSLGYTHTALRKIEEKYATPSMQDVVVAIQILNEPYLIKLDKEMVKSFYRDAYYKLREISDTPIMLHDGFFEPSWMNGFLTPQDNNAQNVIVDHHEYQIFDKDLLAFSVEQHLNLMCSSVRPPIPCTTSPLLLTRVHRPPTSPAPINGQSVGHSPLTSSPCTN